jgi:hypothetical protein
MRNKFQAKFIKLLREAPELEFDPAAEEAAAAGQLDDGINLDEYGVDTEADPNVMATMGDGGDAQNQQMISTVDSWKANFEKIDSYLRDNVLSAISQSRNNTIIGDLTSELGSIERILNNISEFNNAIDMSVAKKRD